MNLCGVSADLLGLVFGVGFTIVRGQDFGVTLDSATWSSSEDTGFNPVASEKTSAPGYKVTLLVISDLLLSLLTEIGTALELDGWSIGEELATSGLMTPPELDDDLVRSVIGTGGLEVWIGVLALGTLGAILRNFPWKGTAVSASFVDADIFLGCACAFGSISSSDEEDDENFLCLLIFFPVTGLLAFRLLIIPKPLVDLRFGNYLTLMKCYFS